MADTAIITWQVSYLRYGRPRRTFNSWAIPRGALRSSSIRDGLTLPLRINGPDFHWSGHVAITSGEEVRLSKQVGEGLRSALRGSQDRPFVFSLTTTAGRGDPTLTVGAVYTRNDLRTLFNIKDATLNNGVFRHKRAIWLFVTEKKTADRVQYEDKLRDDTLRWQGQTAGRTDHLIVNHSMEGRPLFVFYRHRKTEHAELASDLKVSSPIKVIAVPNQRRLPL
jgi:hypothetical protein